MLLESSNNRPINIPNNLLSSTLPTPHSPLHIPLPLARRLRARKMHIPSRRPQRVTTQRVQYTRWKRRTGTPKPSKLVVRPLVRRHAHELAFRIGPVQLAYLG